MILRYLAGFGPASVMDIQAWSGLTRLREVTDRLRPGLRVFRGEDGRELLDLPDAPPPGPDTPAPVRFLPAFDNLITGYRDRTRMMTARQQAVVCDGAVVAAVVLVDGVVRGTWALRTGDGTATLHIEPFTPLSAAERSAVHEEGERLLGFAAGDAGMRAVRVLDPA
jgi:hypothetical protein